MSIIRWKFKSLKNEPYNNVQFSGIDISVSDLCDLIMKAKNMKPGESKLQIFDASTGEGNISCVPLSTLANEIM